MGRGAIPAAVVAAVLLAGCGGSDGGGQGEGADGGRTARDQQVAAASALRALDFPGGWTGRAVPTSPASSLCPAARKARTAASGYAPAPVFVNEKQGTVTQTVEVFPDVAAARAQVAARTAAAERSCSAGRLRARVAKVAEGAQLGQPTTRRESVDLPQIDQAVIVSLNVPIAARGDSGGISAVSLVVRIGRGVTLMTFTNPDGTFDPEVRNRLIAIVAIRLRRQLASA